MSLSAAATLRYGTSWHSLCPTTNSVPKLKVLSLNFEYADSFISRNRPVFFKKVFSKQPLETGFSALSIAASWQMKSVGVFIP